MSEHDDFEVINFARRTGSVRDTTRRRPPGAGGTLLLSGSRPTRSAARGPIRVPASFDRPVAWRSNRTARLAVIAVGSLAAGWTLPDAMPRAYASISRTFDAHGVDRIVMEADRDGVAVTYEFRRPSTRARVDGLAGPIADGLVSAVHGTRLDPSGFLIAEHPSTRMTVRLRTVQIDRDSTYPLARPLGGGGYVVFAPYVLTADRPDVVIREGSRSRTVRGIDAQGYVTVGATVSRRRRFDLVSATGTAPETVMEVTSDADRILSLYRRRMGPPRPRRPTLIVDAAAACGANGGGPRRGDLGDNGVILIRIPSCPTEDGRTGLRRFLAHELFHLWNGRLGGGERDWWLAEGGAEYASSWAVSEIWPADDDRTARIDAAVRACQLALGAAPLDSLDPVRARNARYPCGTVASWIVDLAARRGAHSDFLAVMRSAMDGRDRYSVTSFRRVVADVAPTASPVLDDLLSRTSPSRWTDLAAAADALDADVSVLPTSGFAFRLAVAKAVVGSACGSLRGVGEERGALYVQAGTDCAAFGTKSYVEAVDGMDPMARPSDVYGATRRICASRGRIPIAIRRDDGAIERFGISCSREIEQVSATLRVEAWLKGRTTAVPTVRPEP